jgi:uncharacterized protein YcfJ
MRQHAGHRNSRGLIMNKSKNIVSLVAGSVALALLAACNEDAPVTQAAAKQTPREVCTEQVVTEQKEAKDKDRVLGTLAGAVVGGVVGHEVGGKGTSQDVATIGGAAAGGYAGNRVQKSMQKNATETSTKTVCRTVYE